MRKQSGPGVKVGAELEAVRGENEPRRNRRLITTGAFEPGGKWKKQAFG
jgi:hypothetical protein